VRPVLVLVSSLGLALVGSARGAPASDPAFLGIVMSSPTPGLCEVQRVEESSPADAAHLLPNDLIITFEGQRLVATPTIDACRQLTNAIATHAVGDVVHFDVIRHGTPTALSATLSSRSELLNRLYIDRPAPTLTLIDAEDPETSISLDVGRTTIVGWYFPSLCIDCHVTFERLADRAAKRTGREIQVIAAARPTSSQQSYESIDPKDLVDALGVRHGVAPGVRAAATGAPAFKELIEEPRIYFTVIDRGGVVRFIAPASPEADDVDAVLDEIVAAAEHCERARVGHH